MGFVAPAGTRLLLSDLLAGAWTGVSGDASGRLRSGLADVAGREAAWLYSTGRAAMTVALEAMKRVAGDPRRIEVIIPGYTCYSVPAAIERAGLQPRLCDVDPLTLSPDIESIRGIDFGRVLAIVSANLYGLPNNLSAIEALARERGIFMLDDAAQALGARLSDRAVGGFGDVGLYSLDKGKNITTLQGGALVAGRGRLADALDVIVNEIRPVQAKTSLATLTKLPLYALLLRPSLYAAVRRLPLGLGLTPYETSYAITRYPRSLAGMACRQLQKLDDFGAVRISNAAVLRDALEGVSGVELVRPVARSRPVFPRFPILVDPAIRSSLVEALEASGIGATKSYPCALVDVPEVSHQLPADQAPTPGARDVARRIVTLPTHAFCPPDLGRRVAEVARSVLVA